MEWYIALDLVPNLIMTSSIHQHGLIIIHELQELNKLRESIVLLFLPRGKHLSNSREAFSHLRYSFSFRGAKKKQRTLQNCRQQYKCSSNLLTAPPICERLQLLPPF